jgi:release factor glutamine methyltransferase
LTVADHAAVARTLAEAGCIAAGEEARELIAAAGGDAALLADMVARRAGGEPLAWVTGSIVFCGIELSVEPGVYVPRWQTEPLARQAAELLPAGGTGVDLSTGAGAIAAVMADRVPTARVLATEIDPVAARCAAANGVDVLVGHLDEPLPAELEGAVDVLCAVVPYVPTSSLALLPRDVREHEPRLALDGGRDGMGLLSEVCRRSVRWLRPGGSLLLELGGDQAGPTTRLLEGLGFSQAEVMADEEGDPRAIRARRD